MKLLEITLPTPAENIALDESLLDEAERAPAPRELLRIWEPERPLVVIGRSSSVAEEVDEQACRALDVPVLRRSSGGAAIVAAPGCLMYAVVLDLEERPELHSIDRAHSFVLETIAGALLPLVSSVARRGTSDLASGDRKFSGNSLRVKRRTILYHGTLMYDMSLDLIGRCLGMPPRVPDYRQGRSHADFVTNLPLSREALVAALRDAWNAVDRIESWPRELTHRLVEEKYSRREWNYQR